MRADVFDTEKRSAVMRAVKSRDTSPELAVRAAVRALGYARRYRLNGAGLPGKPDLVFSSLGKAIFVHGCFWHGHGCAPARAAARFNAGAWAQKIAANRAQFELDCDALRAAGWQVERVWECQLDDASAIERLAARLLQR